jgi:hypothetical protein
MPCPNLIPFWLVSNLCPFLFLSLYQCLSLLACTVLVYTVVPFLWAACMVLVVLLPLVLAVCMVPVALLLPLVLAVCMELVVLAFTGVKLG